MGTVPENWELRNVAENLLVSERQFEIIYIPPPLSGIHGLGQVKGVIGQCRQYNRIIPRRVSPIYFLGTRHYPVGDIVLSCSLLHYVKSDEIHYRITSVSGN